jgi:hypothetical protein
VVEEIDHFAHRITELKKSTSLEVNNLVVNKMDLLNDFNLLKFFVWHFEKLTIFTLMQTSTQLNSLSKKVKL